MRLEKKGVCAKMEDTCRTAKGAILAELVTKGLSEEEKSELERKAREKRASRLGA